MVAIRNATRNGTHAAPPTSAATSPVRAYTPVPRMSPTINNSNRPGPMTRRSCGWSSTVSGSVIALLRSDLRHSLVDRREHVDHIDQSRPGGRPRAVTIADQSRHHRAVDGAHQRGEQFGAHRAAGPLDDFDHRVGALRQDAPLDVAQPRLARTRDVPLVAGDQLLGDP